jgi:hypothetical protein
MPKNRIAFAALAFLLSAGLAAPGHAEESRGGAHPEMMKSPRKKEPRDTRAPAEQGTPAAKPDGAKIVFF